MTATTTAQRLTELLANGEAGDLVAYRRLTRDGERFAVAYRTDAGGYRIGTVDFDRPVELGDVEPIEPRLGTTFLSLPRQQIDEALQARRLAAMATEA